MKNIREKLVDGVVIGLTTAIMIIFVTFLWDRANLVGDVMYAVEDKMVEVITVFNETADNQTSEIAELKLKVEDLENENAIIKESLKSRDDSVNHTSAKSTNLLPQPMPIQEPVIEPQPIIISEKNTIPQIQQYERPRR